MLLWTGSLSCSSCQQETPYDPLSSFTQLTPNTQLIALAEKLLAEEQARSERKIIYTVSALLSHTVFCGACVQEPATIFCYDCPEHVFQEFCDACNAEEHTSKVPLSAA